MDNETWWSAQVALRVLGVCSPVLAVVRLTAVLSCFL